MVVIVISGFNCDSCDSVVVAMIVEDVVVLFPINIMGVVIDYQSSHVW